VEEDRGQSLRALGWIGGGALLALAASLLRGATRDPSRELAGHALAPAGEVALWAADRDAGELCGLDEDLILARRVALDRPFAVRALSDGGAWVLRAAAASPSSPSHLARIAADGSVEIEIELGTCTALELAEGRDALVVERGTGAGGADRALRCDEDGSRRPVIEAPGITCLSAAGPEIIVGTSGGEILRAVELVDRVRLDAPIAALAPGTGGDGVWVLFGEGDSRLARLGSDLRLRWSVPTEMLAACLAPVPGEERVWIADAARPLARLFGPQGALEIERADLPLAGIARGVARRDGSVLLVAPGAILRLDRSGRTAPGQGGFAYLGDLDRVPGRIR
jgi:hypothetical protein